jgi:hypothetical protein
MLIDQRFLNIKDKSTLWKRTARTLAYPTFSQRASKDSLGKELGYMILDMLAHVD